MNNGKICRLCLKACKGNSRPVQEITKDVLEILLVNMELDISENPVKCKECIENLIECFEFKSVCISTEEQVIAVLESRRLGKTNMKQVYLRNTKNYSTLSRLKEVCRFCLKPTRKFFTIDQLDEDMNFYDMVQRFLPEMKLPVTNNPVSCSNCLSCLKNYFTFLKICQDVEECIKAYCKSKNITKGKVELNDVMQYMLKHIMDRTASENAISTLKEEIAEEITFIKKQPVETHSSNSADLETVTTENQPFATSSESGHMETNTTEEQILQKNKPQLVETYSSYPVKMEVIINDEQFIKVNFADLVDMDTLTTEERLAETFSSDPSDTNVPRNRKRNTRRLLLEEAGNENYGDDDDDGDDDVFLEVHKKEKNTDDIDMVEFKIDIDEHHIKSSGQELQETRKGNEQENNEHNAGKPEIDTTQKEKQNQNEKKNVSQSMKKPEINEQKLKLLEIKEHKEETKSLVKMPSEDSDSQLQDEEDTSFDGPYQSSSSEYIPDTNECKSYEDEEIRNELNQDMTKNSSKVLASTLKNYDEPTNKGDELPSTNNVEGVIASFGRLLPTSSNVEQFENTTPWTKKCSCPYCFQDVTHFPRHLQRNHQTEGAVKQLLAMSVKNSKRRELLNAIRRQGNFLSTSRTKVIHPVRRPKACENYSSNVEDVKEKYIVCQDCLGYFKRNYLRRHRRQCSLRSKSNEIGNREQHLSAAQLFTVCNGANNDFYSALRLKSEVFPIMRNDEISKIAMNDTLICCFAESLLRRHKRTQIKNVISNKMRELGRFLLTLKEITGLQRLFDVLQPQFFDNCISAIKIISGYEEETRTFKASSLALHMGTTLKQICDIGTKMIIKKSPLFFCPKPEETLKDIKRLKNLIQNRWNSEISSLALKNLNEQRYEKPKLLPLTQDVMRFQHFVLEQAKEASKALRENRKIKVFYRKLSECVLALTVLLNRKRIGEIQSLKSKTYFKTNQENQQEELLQTLSETERTLTKKFKRVVTEGKGSRSVTILFPRDIQEFIEVLFSVRNLCVPDTNEYLFANPNTTNGWLNGSNTLKKLAEESGVHNTSLFTSSRLRKQIATVLQVLNITEDEMEQFGKFMEHTRETHKSYYRVPQDIYQIAKVTKLLIAINSGKGSVYKGKTLDEIELSDTQLEDSDVEENNMDDLMLNENASSHLEVHPVCNKKNYNDKNKVTEVKKKKITRIRWTGEQRKLITGYFEEYIKKKKAPKKREVESFINQHGPTFKEKNWIKVKAFVYNCYKQ